MAREFKPPRRLLILGGDGVGLGVAVFLLPPWGYELTIVEEGARLGRDVNPFYLWGYTKILREKKATLLRASRLTTVAGKEARITGSQGERTVEIDGIIVARREHASKWISGRRTRWHTNYSSLVMQNGQGGLQNAMHDGYRLGWCCDDTDH